MWLLGAGSYDFTMASSHRLLNMVVRHTKQHLVGKGQHILPGSQISCPQVSEGYFHQHLDGKKKGMRPWPLHDEFSPFGLF